MRAVSQLRRRPRPVLQHGQRVFVHRRVNGGGKVDHMGGSIVGLRLSTFSEKVPTNWPAIMMLL